MSSGGDVLVIQLQSIVSSVTQLFTSSNFIYASEVPKGVSICEDYAAEQNL